MSDFNINENADAFDDTPKKQHIIVRLLKILALGVILFICLALFYRCATSADHPIVKKVLMDEEFLAAYSEMGDGLDVRQYGIEKAWADVSQGRLIEFNCLYHIPKLNKLQVSLKYNHDIVKGEFTEIPFRLRLVDEEGRVFDEYFFETASRERYRYIRVSFDNIELEKNAEDENGNKLYHTYVLEIDMINEDGEYKPLCKHELYNGESNRNDVFKRIKYKVE